MYDDIIEFIEKYKDVNGDIVKNKIRDIRLSKGLTPAYFSKHMHISSTQFTQYEKLSNPNKLSVLTLIKICHVLNIKLEDLL